MSRPLRHTSLAPLLLLAACSPDPRLTNATLRVALPQGVEVDFAHVTVLQEGESIEGVLDPDDSLSMRFEVRAGVPVELEAIALDAVPTALQGWMGSDSFTPSAGENAVSIEANALAARLGRL